MWHECPCGLPNKTYFIFHSCCNNALFSRYPELDRDTVSWILVDNIIELYPSVYILHKLIHVSWEKYGLIHIQHYLQFNDVLKTNNVNCTKNAKCKIITKGLCIYRLIEWLMSKLFKDNKWNVKSQEYYLKQEKFENFVSSNCSSGSILHDSQGLLC